MKIGTHGLVMVSDSWPDAQPHPCERALDISCDPRYHGIRKIGLITSPVTALSCIARSMSSKS